MLCNNFLNSKSWSILVRSGDQPIDVDQNEEEGSNADSQGGWVFGLSINNVIVILWPLDDNSTVIYGRNYGTLSISMKILCAYLAPTGALVFLQGYYSPTAAAAAARPLFSDLE